MKNPNGYGSVYKLSGKRRKPWIARVTTGWSEEGKQIYQTIGYFKTKQEGMDALALHRVNPVSPKNDITLEELYEEWSASKYKKISKDTEYGYKAAWYQIERYKKAKFKNLRTKHIQNVIDRMSKNNKSRSSMEKVRTLCNLLYKYAMQNDIVDKNYAKFIEMPKTEKKEGKIFTDLEIKKIEEMAESNVWANTILILIYTGMRISEMLELTKFNIDIKNMVIRGGIKTDAGKDRIIPIHPKIQKYVKEWYSQDKSTLIFKDGGKKILPEYYREYLYYPTLKGAGIRRLTPHRCRHTFASLMAKANIDTAHIQKLMGHADYNTTANIYTHFETEELRKAVEKI